MVGARIIPVRRVHAVSYTLAGSPAIRLTAAVRSGFLAAFLYE